MKANLRGGKFISLEDTLALEINTGAIVKGDKLWLLTRSPENGSGHASYTRAGALVVTSNSHEPPMGRVKSAGHEMDGEVYLDFTIPEAQQLNPFLPFLQSLADNLVVNHPSGPVKVAVVDVVNQYGERTAGGDHLAESLRRYVCGRPQFSCANPADIAVGLSQNKVSTSSWLGDHGAMLMLKTLNATALISGHARMETGMIDLALQAVFISDGEAPGRMWRRFTFTPAELGVTPEDFEKVTATNHPVPAGALKICVKETAILEGAKAEFIEYAPVDRFSGRRIPAIADFYASLDGEPLRIDFANGCFFDGVIASGEHEIKFGFRASGDMGGFVEKDFKTTISAGETEQIHLMGGMQNGVAVIAADIDRQRTPLTNQPVRQAPKDAKEN
ncbi:MAG: hypothetical protein HY751_00855 [Nitrospinae bacterium]|nr:hypothetical protein [Nitrospinota bacterium]